MNEESKNLATNKVKQNPKAEFSAPKAAEAAKIAAHGPFYAHQAPNFWAVHANDLRRFLYAAIQHCYGDPYAGAMLRPDGGSQQTYYHGDWRYVDIWYGGEPFSGMTTVSYRGTVCWVMSYHGVIRDCEHQDTILNGCLRPALRNPDPKYPWRGPKSYVSENGLYTYKKVCKPGKLRYFSGREIIRDPNRAIVYRATFQGGYVDLR